ncbi:unnamed protein product [Adineta steineri]|uniref:EF-hand domain-containing protein n=1 Tax=Adineta steineri TaxID=433720 RepID=A0A815I976_9BILA|nr:unnamed protein product [Adineta steineri]CAF3857471.1 unnamed protein product [Adineta steineri]
MESKKITKVRKTTDLSPKELNVLRSSSKLSDKEIKQWHEEFIKKYPNGKVDKDSFVKLYKELHPQHDEAASKTLIDSIDTDHDGSINFNEFLFFSAANAHNCSLDERLNVMFELWDVTDDGQIDQNELAHLISAMYDRARIKDRQGENNPHARAKAIITKLDVSGDRKLNKEEFVNGCKNDPVVGKLLASNQ